MTSKAEVFVGIDVGKSELDVVVWGAAEVWQISNDEQGVEQLLALVVVEATGGYEQPAAQAMQLNGFSVAVANPTRVRALAKATGKLAKTDEIDALLIAEYAAKIRPEALAPRNEREIHLKALVTRREQLVDMRTAELNRRSTAHPSMKVAVQQHIDWLSSHVQELEVEMKELVASLPAWQARYELLRWLDSLLSTRIVDTNAADDASLAAARVFFGLFTWPACRPRNTTRSSKHFSNGWKPMARYSRWRLQLVCARC